MDIQQFGQTIKAKYPQYNDLSDEELGRKMLAKYPQYNDMVDVEQPKKKGFFRKVGEEIARPFAEVGVGLYNIGSVAQGKGSPTRTLPFLGETKPFATGEESPLESIKKSVGYGADIASNLPLGLGTAKVAKATFKGAFKQGIKAGAKEGGIYGALHGAGTSLEENKDALNVLGNSLLEGGIGTIGGGVFGGAGATAGKGIRGILQPGETISSLGKGTRKFGEKIEERGVIKPIKKDIDAGFKIENVSKYDVGGNLGDSFVKVKNKIKANVDELNKIVKDIDPASNYKFDVKKYVDEIEKKYTKGGLEVLGQAGNLRKEVKNLKNELSLALDDMNGTWKDKLLGFKEVLDMKRRAGLNSAFLHDITKSQPTPEEQVWTDFYMILKEALEKEAPKEFKMVNKTLSELIPIEQALVRRIPIAQRQNYLSLTDMISLVGSTINPTGEKALTVGVVNRMLKSGTIASKLMQTGKAIERTGEKVKPFDALIGSIPKKQGGFQQLPENLKKKTNLPKSLKQDQLIQEAKKYKSAEEFVKKSGIIPEWGTQNQYYENNPYRSQLDEFLKSGVHDLSVYKKSDRWEMNQMLKDKPAYLNNHLSEKEVVEFAKKNNFSYAKDEYGELVVGKNEKILNSVLTAKHGRELGLALGYKDVGVLGEGKVRAAKSQLTDIWNKANKK